MATTLAIMLICGLLVNAIFTKIKIPGLLGMLLLGILAGPYALNIIDKLTLLVSADFRMIALVIILLRAGLQISSTSLKKVGFTTLKLSFIPCLIEGFTIAFLSTKLLGFSFIEGGILGFIIAAVSPAVVVPKMLDYIRSGIGTDKNIPTLILASASIEDVFAITVFSVFLGLYSGSHLNIGVAIFNIPLSIIIGIVIGLLTGFILVQLFKKFHIRDTKKVLILLGVAFLITMVESVLKSRIQIAGLLGVMTIGFVLLTKIPDVAQRLSLKFAKIWIFAEILVFVLIGAAVNIHVGLDSGLNGLLLISAGLAARSFGVIVSTWGSNLNRKERLFCIIASIPKASVQAAIGAIPLGLGIPGGETILAIAVLSILFTAPLGAVLIAVSAKKLLNTQNLSLEDVAESVS